MLTHVCIWEDGRWRRITESEAEKRFPVGISSNQRLFMCELCGQFVSFTNGKKRRRYFKHSRGESDKSCIERSVNDSYYYTLNKTDFSLPIKIEEKNGDFEFYLGIPLIPDDLFRDYNRKLFAISYGKTLKQYSFERLTNFGVTYFPVGKQLQEKYVLTYDNSNNRLSQFWPKETKGLQGKGRLFSKKTGACLPFDTDVVIGNSYFFVTRHNLYGINMGYGGPKIRFIKSLAGTQNLFEVSPTALNEANAKFFLQIGARLTDIPLKVNVLWPPHQKNDNFYYLNSDHIVIFVNGNAEVYSGISTPMCLGEKKDEWKVYNVFVYRNIHNVLIGRVRLLETCIIMHADKMPHRDPIQIDISDGERNPVINNQYQSPPARKLLTVKSPYDGYVIVYSDKSYRKIWFHGGSEQKIDGINYGTIVEFFVGNDLVRKISFDKKKSAITAKNQITFRQLRQLDGKEYDISTSQLGSIASKFDCNNEIKALLRLYSKKGSIPIKVLQLLQVNKKELFKHEK